jgi:hypothetical protein
MKFPSFEWMKELKKILNADTEFKKAARWFVGTVSLKFGDDNYWLKIDAGSVIEVQEGTNDFGFVFGISGPLKDWKDLITGKESGIVKLTAVTPAWKGGDLTFEGNIVEVFRNFRMVCRMTQDMKNIKTTFK